MFARMKHQRLAPPRPPSSECYPEESVGVADPRAHTLRLVRSERLAERDVLKDEIGVVAMDSGAQDVLSGRMMTLSFGWSILRRGSWGPGP
jgi:hypothetical protein